MKKILECSSKGDIRFSAFYAKVECLGKIDTIENHYQNAKRAEDGSYVTKGSYTHHFVLNINYKDISREFIFDAKYLTAFYKMLWVKYLDNHKTYVEYAATFDDYHDMFKGKNTINCQTDVIRQYIKQGRESIITEIQELNNLIIKYQNILKTEYENMQALTNNTTTKDQTYYKEMNDKVYYGCVGAYSSWPVTKDQIKLITTLVTTYKIKVKCINTRHEATDTIHRIFDKIHSGEIKLRKDKYHGHVEIIDNEYVFVKDNVC